MILILFLLGCSLFAQVPAVNSGTATYPTSGTICTTSTCIPTGSAVTSVATGNGLTGGPITTTGTISGVNAAADGSTKGVSAFTAADFDAATGVISLDYTNGQKASGSQPGFLSSTDWTTFNNKGSGNLSTTGSPAIHQVGVFQGATTITGAAVGATNTVLRGATGADPAFGALVVADLPTSTFTPSIMGGATFLPDSTGNATCITNITISGTPFFLHSTCQFTDPNTTATSCFYGTFTVPGDYTATTTAAVIDFATTATSGNAAFTFAYTDIGATTSIGTTTSASGVLSATATATSGTAGRVTSVSVSLTAADFTKNHTAQYRVCRVTTSDTISATVELINIRFSYVKQG